MGSLRRPREHATSVTSGVPPQGGSASRDRFRELLDVAEAQDAEAGREAWLHRAVERLVPDQARMLARLASLSEPSAGVALIHIYALTQTGVRDEPVLSNATTLARDSGASLPDLGALYVEQLLDLDLVEIGPESPVQHDEYQALLADPWVLAALGRARSAGAMPRVIRHTLRLSELGRGLFAE